MNKFKVLQSNQNLMAQLGISSHRLTYQKNEFFDSKSVWCISFVHIIFTTIASSMFAYKNVSNFAIALDAFSCSLAGMQGCGMFFSIGLNMKKVKALHLKLQKIVDDGGTKFEINKTRMNKTHFKFILNF